MIYSKQAIRSKEDLIRFFYEKEPTEYFKNVHEREGTKEECIQDTLNTVNASTSLYEVYQGVKLVAVFGKYEDGSGELGLELFHVLKEYRTKEFLKEFTDIIKSRFDKTFYTGVYEQNKGAISFLEKAGFDRISEMEQKGKKVFVYSFNK